MWLLIHHLCCSARSKGS